MKNSSPTEEDAPQPEAALPEFSPVYTPVFEDRLRTAKRKNPDLLRATNGATEKVLGSPQCGDGFMAYDWAGKRKLYFGLKKCYRLVFISCAECRASDYTSINGCEFCDETDDSHVVFFWVGPKKERHGDYRI